MQRLETFSGAASERLGTRAIRELPRQERAGQQNEQNEQNDQ